MLNSHYLGEFGIVYCGVMTMEKRVPKAVAVKTLRGTTAHMILPFILSSGFYGISD